MAVRDPLDPDPARDRLTPHPASAGGGVQEARLQVAERLLGYAFRDRARLAEALTHRSAVNQRKGRARANSNERLEFVGDRVLGLIVAEWLIDAYPDEPEGALGRRHAHLVSREVLAKVAERINLAQALHLGPNEAKVGVAQLATVLADATEAVIGALFLDAGLDPARAFVRTLLQPELDAMIAPPKDPKTELQEWLMARGLPLPDYRVAARSGPSHAPEFTIEVTGAGATGSGTAGNKRLAERDAAAALLAKLTHP